MIVRQDRFHELDLIRFIAAISVLVYHYKSKYLATIPQHQALASKTYAFTKFGYLGVDLFFLISGFVILASAFDRTCGQFAISRIIRLYPTFWVCMTITTITLIVNNHNVPLLQYAANMTMFQEYIGIKNIDEVYWTLTTEIKFYICVFFLIVFNLLHNYKIWITIWTLLAILYLCCQQPFFMGWFISPNYSSYFIAGATFYLAKKNGYEFFHIVIIVVSLAISSIYAYNLIDTFSKNITVYDRVVAVIIIWCFYLVFFLISINKIKLNYSYFIFVLGGLTYPVYLLHNVCGKVYFDLFVNKIHPLYLLTIITIMVLLVSYIIHLYLERLVANKVKSYLLQIFSLSESLKKRGNAHFN